MGDANTPEAVWAVAVFDRNFGLGQPHRLQAVHDLAETLELLYAEFLGKRMAPSWPMDLGEIQSWLKRAGQKVGVS